MKKVLFFLLVILLAVFQISKAMAGDTAGPGGTAPTALPTPSNPIPQYLGAIKSTFFQRFPNSMLITNIGGAATVTQSPISIFSPLQKFTVGIYYDTAPAPAPSYDKYVLSTALGNEADQFNPVKTDGSLDVTLVSDKTEAATISYLDYDFSKNVDFRGQTLTVQLFDCSSTPKNIGNAVTLSFTTVQGFAHAFVLTSQLVSAANIQSGVTYVSGYDGQITAQQNSSIGIYYGVELFLAPRCFDYEEECVSLDPLNVVDLLRFGAIAGINVQAPTNGFMLGLEWEPIKRIPLFIGWTPTEYNTLASGETVGGPVGTGGSIVTSEKMDWSCFSVGIDLYPLVGQTLLSALGSGISSILGTGGSTANTKTSTGTGNK